MHIMLGHFTEKAPLHWKHINHFKGNPNIIGNDVAILQLKLCLDGRNKNFQS